MNNAAAPENRRDFIPLLGKSFLTPLSDRAIGIFTRENLWRQNIVEHLHLAPGDRVIDVGSGTGTLLKALMTDCPEAGLIGVEPDPAALAIARRKFGAGADLIKWHNGFLGNLELPKGWRPNKIVSSLVLHQVPLREKQVILETIETLLVPGGTVLIADYMKQDSHLMRALFRATVQSLDGVSDTQPSADGEVEKLFAEIFSEPRLLDRIPTVTGQSRSGAGTRKELHNDFKEGFGAPAAGRRRGAAGAGSLFQRGTGGDLYDVPRSRMRLLPQLGRPC